MGKQVLGYREIWLLTTGWYGCWHPLVSCSAWSDWLADLSLTSVSLREHSSSTPLQQCRDTPSWFSKCQHVVTFWVCEWNHTSCSWMSPLMMHITLLTDVFLKCGASHVMLLSAEHYCGQQAEDVNRLPLCYRLSAVCIAGDLCFTILFNQMWLYSKHFNQLLMINIWALDTCHGAFILCWIAEVCLCHFAYSLV